MIEEELRKKAEDYAEKHAFRVPYDGSNKFYDDVDFKASKEGYLAGAEPREKRIEELIALINAERERQEKCDDIHLRKIADLEKENAELENDYKLIDKSREHLVQEKYNLEYKIENLENKIEHHQEVINTLQKKNAELEKENAKLKEKIRLQNEQEAKDIRSRFAC